MPGPLAQYDADTSLPSTISLPYDKDPLACIAEKIITHYQQRLPDLSAVVVILPESTLHADLRRHLLSMCKDKGFSALLGPRFKSLPEWINETTVSSVKKISTHERELILVEALKAHPDLPGAKQPWLLAENLLNLFDELNRHHVTPSDDPEEFTRQLRKAYGLAQVGNENIISHLDRESHLVHRLWHAWHEQLEAQHADDNLGIYHRKLQASINDKTDTHEYWIAGYPGLSSMEAEWYITKAKAGRAWLFTQSMGAGTTGRSVFLQQAFADNDIDFAQRAKNLAAKETSSQVSDHIRIVQAGNEELEACAVELQVRKWLIDGHRNIGIITQDRRLARRTRALLERAGINLNDNAGWPLSTTSAAAAVERWLECIELDFDNLALRDLLKSPFVFYEKQDENYLKTVFRFEQDLVLHENIASGMFRYKRAIDSREERLKNLWSVRILDSIRDLLDTLDTASKALLTFNNNKQHKPSLFIEALVDSMKQIGMHPALDADPAGQRILHELGNMAVASAQQDMLMSWGEIRSWIGRTLERYSFRPDTRNNTVTLIDLKQSQLMTFDAVVLAGADYSHLPKAPTQQAFFNDTVRYSLGLPTADTHEQEQFHYFLNIMSRNSTILVTHHAANSEGDTVLPSRWIEAICQFHKLAYDDDLTDKQLATQLLLTHTGIITDCRKHVPSVDTQPSPATPVNRLPAWFSASSYQQLLDCPYKFFASRLLGLQASEEISEVLSKTEYGELVHKCLEAFHSNIDYLPGPFSAKITSSNQADAEKLLEDIAKQVFARDINDNFEHRGWLQRFTSLVPGYIEWQRSHNESWDVRMTEETITRHDSATIPIKGRLDRIDSNHGGLCIIDYKTGFTPANRVVLDGEAVQLPFYAMLIDEKVQRVEYLKIDAGIVKSVSALEDEQLESLRADNQQRLDTLVQMLNEEHALPAWGDEATCIYCDMAGLCRRDNWLAGDSA